MSDRTITRTYDKGQARQDEITRVFIRVAVAVWAVAVVFLGLVLTGEEPVLIRDEARLTEMGAYNQVTP